MINNRDAGLLELARHLEIVGDVGWVNADPVLSAAEARGLVASRSLPEGCETGAGHVARLECYNRREALKMGHHRQSRGCLEAIRALNRRRLRPPWPIDRLDVPDPPFDFDREYEGA